MRGRAVLVFNPWGTGPAHGAMQRAEAKGAAAIFSVFALPGNMKLAYISDIGIPNFSIGNDDGVAVRDLIDQASVANRPRVSIRFETREMPNLKSAIVWGTLPGATDERIYVLAHRDGWFDAAIDNGGGIAQQIGLADDFARIPQAQRRRTLVFLATDGHHAPGERTEDDPTGEGGEGEGRTWFRLTGEDGAPWVSKTALFINCEHPAAVDSFVNGRTLTSTNTTMPNLWSAGSPPGRC